MGELWGASDIRITFIYSGKEANRMQHIVIIISAFSKVKMT